MDRQVLKERIDRFWVANVLEKDWAYLKEGPKMSSNLEKLVNLSNGWWNRNLPQARHMEAEEICAGIKEFYNKAAQYDYTSFVRHHGGSGKRGGIAVEHLKKYLWNIY